MKELRLSDAFPFWFSSPLLLFQALFFFYRSIYFFLLFYVSSFLLALIMQAHNHYCDAARRASVSSHTCTRACIPLHFPLLLYTVYMDFYMGCVWCPSWVKCAHQTFFMRFSRGARGRELMPKQPVRGKDFLTVGEKSSYF